MIAASVAFFFVGVYWHKKMNKTLFFLTGPVLVMISFLTEAVTHSKRVLEETDLSKSLMFLGTLLKFHRNAPNFPSTHCRVNTTPRAGPNSILELASDYWHLLLKFMFLMLNYTEAYIQSCLPLQKTSLKVLITLFIQDSNFLFPNHIYLCVGVPTVPRLFLIQYFQFNFK